MPKVNLPARLFNLPHLLGRQLKVPKARVTFDPLFILGRSDCDDAVLNRPPE